MQAEERAEKFRHMFASLTREIGKVVVGHAEIVRGVLICLFSGGHALLEGVPGLGKTLLVKTLAEGLDLRFSRIQFTPDLMPADIVGTNIVVETPGGRHFGFQRGPLFGQIVLADEVNRATPKTQSALLEAMQELSVTVGGTHHSLERPFFVLATQNPIEMEGTYPLPEAQLDRFLLKLKVEYPSAEDLAEIIERTTKPVTHPVQKAAAGPEVEDMKNLVREVPVPQPVKEYVSRLDPRHTAGPRGGAGHGAALRAIRELPARRAGPGHGRQGVRPDGRAVQRELRRHPRGRLSGAATPPDPLLRGRSGRDSRRPDPGGCA